MGFADTLNSFSDRRSTPRVKIDRRHLEESFLAYQLVQFDLFMGEQIVSIPNYFVDLNNYIFCQFPRRYIAYVYFWSNHKTFVGPCSNQCSEVAVMDGHVKSRRRICNYKDVSVSTSEYDKIVKGCRATPVRGSKYCPDHAFANNDESKTPETSIQSTANGERFSRRTQVKRSTDFEQQTSYKTLKRKVHAYVRKCTRSFGLIAQVFNCRVITAFSEIYRSETIKQILDVIFTANRRRRFEVSFPPFACPLDKNYLVCVKFQTSVHPNTFTMMAVTALSISRNVAKMTPSNQHQQLSGLDTVQWSIDRMHVKNHTRQYCKTVLNPDFNPGKFSSSLLADRSVLLL